MYLEKIKLFFKFCDFWLSYCLLRASLVVLILCNEAWGISYCLIRPDGSHTVY